MQMCVLFPSESIFLEHVVIKKNGKNLWFCRSPAAFKLCILHMSIEKCRHCLSLDAVLHMQVPIVKTMIKKVQKVTQTNFQKMRFCLDKPEKEVYSVIMRVFRYM